MSEKSLTVEIATPQKKSVHEQVMACSAPGVLGRFQVLVDHTAFISELGIGELKIDYSDRTQVFAVSGGFLEVLDNRVLLLLESFEAPDEIDVERARRAMERAWKRLQTRPPGTNIPRAKIALARALNRLRVAEKIS